MLCIGPAIATANSNTLTLDKGDVMSLFSLYNLVILFIHDRIFVSANMYVYIGYLYFILVVFLSRELLCTLTWYIFRIGRVIRRRELDGDFVINISIHTAGGGRASRRGYR